MNLNHNQGVGIHSFTENFSDNDKLKEDQINIVIIVNEVCSGFSILASLLVIIIFWYFKEIRKIIYELAVWLCVSNIFYEVTAYFPYSSNKQDNYFWCGTQAFMIIFFQTSSWIIGCIIGYSSFISVIKREHLDKYETAYRIFFIFVTLIISAGVSSIVLFSDAFGPTGGWCWLDVRNSDKSSIVHKLVWFYYCVTWFFIILNSFFIFKMIYILRKNVRNIKIKSLLQIYQRLKWYPICQIICLLPGTLIRVLDLLDVLEPSFAIIIIQTIFGSIVGVLYFIIYIRLPHVKNSLRVLYSKLIRKESPDEMSEIFTSEDENNEIRVYMS